MSALKKKNRSGSPMVRAIVIPFIGAVILQSLVFYCTLAMTGTVKNVKAGSENILAESASKCSVYLETEMTRKWSGLSDVESSAPAALSRIAEENNLTGREILESDLYASEFLNDISGSLLETLRINSVSGSFIVLADSADRPDENTPAEFRGIFFSDGDPDFNPSDYSDIMMVIGSSSVSEKNSIPLDINWSEKFHYAPGETDMNYFFKPVFAGYDYPYAGAYNLGYWNRPFCFINDSGYDNELIITYSEPLVYDGTVFGTVGVSVTVDSISELLPTDSIADIGGCCALLTYEYDDILADVEAVSDNYSSFEENEGMPVALIDSDESMLKKIPDAQINGSEAYCALNELELYPENSPYGAERWAVAAIAGRDDIYAPVEKIRVKLFIALGISVLIGLILVIPTAGRLVSPVGKLAESVRKAGENGCIEPVKTSVAEINELSEALNKMSAKRIEYRNELITERERYMLAVQSTKDSILEYDCENDTLYVYNFKPNNGEKYEEKVYDRFKKRVEDGNVCPENSIPDMMDFLDGVISKNGACINIKAGDDTDRLMWMRLEGKSVYDTDGKLMRVIAITKDVTEECEREQSRLEEERRDPITGFYKSEYGGILASRFDVETNGQAIITAIVRIAEMNKMFETCGQTFCAAVLEEAAIVIRRIVPENYIVYRGESDEFVIVTPLTVRDEARKLFREILDGISGIYDGRLKIECVIGAYLKFPGEAMSASKLKTRFASEAAYRFRKEYGGIVFADEASAREDFMIEFKKAVGERNVPQIQPLGEDRNDIVSFAFNIFEKSSDFEAALTAMISRAGRIMGMRRIIVFDMNRDYFTMRPSAQWRAPDMAPIEVKTYSYGKAAYLEMEEKFAGIDCKIADPAVFERDAVHGMGKISAEGTTYSVSMLDNDTITGIMIYQRGETDADDTLKICMKELTKVVSAYVSKSRTSRESKAKSEFLSKMSHEIRTPMNAIIGMTEIAGSSGEASPYITDCLKKIESSSRYLMSLINDILDMSRIESGKMTAEETYLNLDELIGRLDTMIRVQTENKGIWFKVETKISHPHLLGDPLKLNQILVNILGNAVKFTDSGGITMRVAETGDDTESVRDVFFSVKDTGIGISPENLERIFNSFEQADADTMRKYGGTGLGLAISSNLVRLLGGNLEVKSALGEGSEFYFTLPMKVTEPPAEASGEADGTPDIVGRRVLIAEDDDLNAEIAQTLFEDQGIISERAENGKVAVDKFEASEKGYYDAILMDIRMPMLDGIEATKRIRGSEHPDAAKIPIIAMTANAFDEDMKKSVECGMNGHLTKPIDMKKVMETFHRIWRS